MHTRLKQSPGSLDPRKFKSTAKYMGHIHKLRSQHAPWCNP
jgi:hypothetical protein